MKRFYKPLLALFAILMTSACSDFEDINVNPSAFESEQVSAKFFLTGIQIELYAEATEFISFITSLSLLM